jgi:hypothetical protein
MSQLTLNLPNGSVAFNFPPDAAQDLRASLGLLMESLKQVANKPAPGSKVIPQKSVEYHYSGEVWLEIFCNPNIYPTPYAAKVLITLKTTQVRLCVEAELSRVIEDVNQYLAQN